MLSWKFIPLKQSQFKCYNRNDFLKCKTRTFHISLELDKDKKGYK